METFVKYVFILQICLAPLGLALALLYLRAARKSPDKSQQRYYRALALARFVVAFLDASIGPLGYYLVTRRVLPWMDSSWLLVLVALSGVVLILLTKRAANIRIQAQASKGMNNFPSATSL
jgi:hypothetical protein